MCVHMYTHTYMCIHTHKYVYGCICIYTHTHIYVYTCVFICACVQVFTCVCVCVYMYTQVFSDNDNLSAILASGANADGLALLTGKCFVYCKTH